jgi:beta-lactamase regulating signal transducer with metallopeptidase domain
MTANLESLAQLSAERILNCTAEGMVVALLAWFVLRASGRQNSGTRFAVWFAALLGIAALPLLGYWAATNAGLARPSEITMPGSWAIYIFAGWLLIAAAGLLRVGIGFWHLHRLRKRCVPVEAATLDPLLRKTLEEFEGSRGVQLCVSDRLRVPTAIGFRKALVVIPSWTMRELSAPELNSILLHELAHLRRRDDWTNLVQKIVGALLFFHPAVWWIEKKLALEREMACDDLVLAQTSSPRAYAECLVSLAEKSFLRRGIALAQAAVDRLRQVTLRVSQILDVDRPRATRVWRPAPVLVAGVSVVCLLAVSHTPTRLVSFENAPFENGAATVTASATANAISAGDSEAGRLSRMGAHVVPAKLQLRAPEAVQKASAPVLASLPVKNPARPADKASLIAANAAERRIKIPRLLRASVPITPRAAGEDAAPQALLVEVVQTRQYDATGAVVWDLCVWRVTVVGPVQNKMAGTAAKST